MPRTAQCPGYRAHTNKRYEFLSPQLFESHLADWIEAEIEETERFCREELRGHGFLVPDL